MSGKTTLAKRLAASLHNKDKTVLVFDPLGDPDWICDFQTKDFEEFLRVCKMNRSCFLFVDESSTSCGQHDKEALWLATMSRHWGHSSTFIAKRTPLISTTIRYQCGELFLFSCSLTDAKLLSDDWNKAELREAHNLGKGEYFRCSRFSPVTKHALFKEEKK